ncbi:DUF1217 domain-containing protein [Consotaella salsifontis]|uniref:DUF1217 domain-containing protein n=1 Tax=Consotaella salsifontis TaxID=1365950 RepID=A0A1T4SQT6_9HYPH|nr:DUF1217 domain-containing protein [Consotaella salsifontis]SKA30537.1 Protein of unknown function [Consotaella salsifontis]
MLSTLLAYRMVANDPDRALARVEANPVNKREAEYYQDNIGNVRSVDDFIGNFRLFRFAMTAYGLEEKVNQQGFMRKVLESDLSDKNSFANRLVDKRFVAFAKAFNFSADGSVSSTPEIQTATQENNTVEAYSEWRVRNATAAAAETNYFRDHFRGDMSVDDLLNDDRLYQVVMKSADIDTTYLSKSYVRQMLTADYTDRNAFPAGSQGAKYFELAGMLRFDSTGAAPARTPEYTADLIDQTSYNYNVNTDNIDSPQAEQYMVDHFTSKIDTITNVNDLVADPKACRYIFVAFGLDPDLEYSSSIQQALTSDLNDPNSWVRKLPVDSAADVKRKTSYMAMASMFDFGTDGTADPAGAITDEEKQQLSALFHEHNDDKSETMDKLSTAIFRGKIRKVTTLNSLLYDKSLLEYALKACDIDPEKVSQSQLRKVLTSDLSDPKSYVNRLGDERFVNLAASFNFDANGKVGAPKPIQTLRDQQATATLYTAALSSSATTAQKAKAKEEVTYYLEKMPTLHKLDDFVADDRLTKFVLAAHGVEDQKVTPSMWKKILASDITDPKNYASSLGSQFADIAASFNFDKDGKVAASDNVQTVGGVAKTRQLFLRQTMETDAGQQNEGARLALYFQRKAPEVKSAYDILADKALTQAVRTAFGLPDQMSQMDIDVQAKILDKKLNYDDFKDPKKLDALVARFAAMYDLKNDTSASSPAVSLISGINTGGTGLLGYL